MNKYRITYVIGFLLILCLMIPYGVKYYNIKNEITSSSDCAVLYLQSKFAGNEYVLRKNEREWDEAAVDWDESLVEKFVYKQAFMSGVKDCIRK